MGSRNIRTTNLKLTTKQTKQTKTKTKLDKIEKYLVELRPKLIEEKQVDRNQPQPTNTNTTTRKQQDITKPAQMSLMDKMRKFSSKSPPKLPPKTTSTTTRGNQSGTTTIMKPGEKLITTTTTGRDWGTTTTTKPGEKTTTQQQNQNDNSGQDVKPEVTTNNIEQQQNVKTTTTTTLMEIIRNKKRQQQDNNKTTPKQNNKKPKQATSVKKPVTDQKSQPSPDIRLFLANKRVQKQIEARAAAKNPPNTPTQVRETSIKPSTEATSARSNSAYSADVPGDSFAKPNVMTQPGGEVYERTCMIGYNQTV